MLDLNHVIGKQTFTSQLYFPHKEAVVFVVIFVVVVVVVNPDCLRVAGLHIVTWCTSHIRRLHSQRNRETQTRLCVYHRAPQLT